MIFKIFEMYLIKFCIYDWFVLLHLALSVFVTTTSFFLSDLCLYFLPLLSSPNLFVREYFVQVVITRPLSCSGEETWQHGNSLVNYMKLVEMNGLTGKVWFLVLFVLFHLCLFFPR